MRKPVDRHCPHCHAVLGLARAVATVLVRNDITVVTMVCESCGYEWLVDQKDPIPVPMQEAS